MANTQQITGMMGVYLVAAELSKLGFIVSPTSRSAFGADLLVTDQFCHNSFSVQVKTNKRAFNFWLLNAKAKELVSPSHIYVLVNIRKNENEYFVVPSKVVAKKMYIEKSKSNSIWYSISYSDVEKYKNVWDLFGNPNGQCD